MLRIIVELPDGGEMAFHTDEQDLFIGRVPSINDICLSDTSVSRQHAHIKKREEGYTIYDLKSLNGVILNGARVSRALLKDGDRIRIGNVRLGVRLRLAGREEDLAEIDGSERTRSERREKEIDEPTRQSSADELRRRPKPKRKRGV